MNAISTMAILRNNTFLLSSIKFYLVLSLQIPAILLFLFIFAFFITSHGHLRKLQNQALLLLFIVNFIQLTLNIPILVHFLRLNRVDPPSGIYCKCWMYIESTLDTVNELLVAVMCIQRHVLVFRPNFFHQPLKRYIFYYLPLLFSVVYPSVFYMGAVIFYPCDETQWDYTANMCGDTICYLSNNTILAMFDWVFNSSLPIAVIILANIALVARVIRQKFRRQRTISWSKQRRMTVQLVSMSSLYLSTWLPTIISGVLHQMSPSDYLDGIEEDYISDLTYLICLLLPWICMGLLPDFTKWMLKHFRRLQNRSNLIRPISQRT